MNNNTETSGTYEGQNKAKLWGGYITRNDDCDSGWSYAG